LTKKNESIRTSNKIRNGVIYEKSKKARKLCQKIQETSQSLENILWHQCSKKNPNRTRIQIPRARDKQHCPAQAISSKYGQIQLGCQNLLEFPSNLPK
jgi:ribosomal protein L31E